MNWKSNDNMHGQLVTMGDDKTVYRLEDPKTGTDKKLTINPIAIALEALWRRIFG